MTLSASDTSCSSFCVRLFRYVTCTQRRFFATKTDAKLSSTHQDLQYPRATMTSVFEPRIEVLEKLVTDLKNTVEQSAHEGTVQSINMTRVTKLLETLRAEHMGLATCVSRLQQVQLSSSTDNATCEVANMKEVQRPTLVLPPPPLQPHLTNNVKSSATYSSPVNIPHTNATVHAEAPVLSPAWFPVSEGEEIIDAYSSDEDDRSAAEGGPRMMDA